LQDLLQRSLRSCHKKSSQVHRTLLIVRIFTASGTNLVEITRERFPLEREVQRMTETNLQDLFNLDFVKSEFELNYLRIDTLALIKNLDRLL
jgi:hypothetical protein